MNEWIYTRPRSVANPPHIPDVAADSQHTLISTALGISGFPASQGPAIASKKATHYGGISEVLFPRRSPDLLRFMSVQRGPGKVATTAKSVLLGGHGHYRQILACGVGSAHRQSESGGPRAVRSMAALPWWTLRQVRSKLIIPHSGELAGLGWAPSSPSLNCPSVPAGWHLLALHSPVPKGAAGSPLVRTSQRASFRIANTGDGYVQARPWNPRSSLINFP
ncbi:uncharacterized protein LY89DRAFT_665073 [Mollisia scopiformis]|uniref:Uncharacterized protein n=1 Tax=Mollisia scopiformis TaxID=149040 RepID=A0A194XNV8_MOLSC|nr:uncharacterized protein LY89DRAFT_665073 [Mollisia scopiformis]KUJ21920.1 hypothetical protein LY89DRAFT_665073 [Mollisia scopiformis]